MPKMVFSMKCRKSLCLKNTTILRFMYIFTECRKDLYQNVFSMKCRKSLCQKYDNIESRGSSIHRMKEGFMPKIVFSMKCRKSLSQKYDNIESVGRFMYILTECRKDLCQK